MDFVVLPQLPPGDVTFPVTFVGGEGSPVVEVE